MTALSDRPLSFLHAAKAQRFLSLGTRSEGNWTAFSRTALRLPAHKCGQSSRIFACPEVQIRACAASTFTCHSFAYATNQGKGKINKTSIPFWRIYSSARDGVFCRHRTNAYSLLMYSFSQAIQYCLVTISLHRKIKMHLSPPYRQLIRETVARQCHTSCIDAGRNIGMEVKSHVDKCSFSRLHRSYTDKRLRETANKIEIQT